MTSFWPIFIAMLFGSWCVLVFDNIRVRRRLAGKSFICVRCQKSCITLGTNSAANASQALQALGKAAVFSLEDFPDKDGNGVPDAFQRRRPLAEILEFDSPEVKLGDPDQAKIIIGDLNEYWVAIELPARPPRKFEYFILDREGIVQSSINYSDDFKAIIIKQTRGWRPEDLVDLTK